jgi:transcriptional regulator with PAS, ATPase and Fis domain
MTFIDASLAAVLFGALVILGTLGAFHMSWFRKPHQPGEDGEIPIRVRQTLDTIVGGVVILDIQERILFANESFAACLGQTPEQLKGVVLASLPWRMDHDGEWPWQHVLRESQPQTAIKLHLRIHAANEMSFMVNATPLLDASNQLCSALVSFENITLIEDQRQELVRTLKALEVYQDQIRGQNEILHELANRDSLTGVYNRRALFAKVEARWEDRNEGTWG